MCRKMYVHTTSYMRHIDIDVDIYIYTYTLTYIHVSI